MRNDLAYKIPENLFALSDEEVLRLSNLIMNDEQDERLGYLHSKRKAEGLSQPEETELSELMQIYYIGLLHKAQGLAEAVRRGLREPLHP